MEFKFIMVGYSEYLWSKIELDPNLKTELIGSSKVFVFDFRTQVRTGFRTRAKQKKQTNKNKKNKKNNNKKLDL